MTPSKVCAVEKNVPCPRSSVAERSLGKGEAASPILALGTIFDAGIAQLVERNLAKVEVASSNLVSRSSVCRSCESSTSPSLAQARRPEYGLRHLVFS
jgi:CxxC motif-containing protein (DUF1111 family)